MATSTNNSSAKLAICLEKLHKRCSKDTKNHPGDEFLQRASKRCKELTDQGEGAPDFDNNKSVCTWLKEYTQAVLDVTYFEENQLVERDFAEPQGKAQLHDILNWLTEPCELVAEILGTGIEVKDALGCELVECLLWRRGALLYMYCSTLQESPERVYADRQHFLQCADTGVISLKQMLQTRVPLTEQRQHVLTNDDSTFQLLQKGLFSDTHVLGLMYGGELCHWYTQYNTPDTPTRAEFEPRQVGTELLGLYIDAVNGPLNGKGWTVDRAQELLGELKKS